MKSQWPKWPISDLCLAIVDCVNRTAPIVKGPTPYRMIRTTNVRGGFLDLTNVNFVEEAVYQRWTRRQVPKRGDIVLTREAPLGEVGLVRDDAGIFLGQRLVSYRVNPALADERYLLYTLLGPDLQGQIQALGSGSTVAHMRVPDAKRLLIPKPPLETQQRIGSILAAYDDLIDVNRRRIALLEEMARRLFDEWFVRFNFPGHESQTMVETPDGKIPTGWSLRPFTDVAEVLSGGTPRKNQPQYWQGAIPFFTPRDAPKDAWALLTDANISEEGLRTCNSQLYDVGTVFITARGTVGKVSLAGRPMAMNQSCYALRGRGYPQFFLFQLTRAAVDRLRSMSNGAVFDTIIVDTFRRLEIVVPPLELAVRFDDTVKSKLLLARNLSLANQALATSRDLVLPRLVSGELSVETAENELEAVA